MPKERKLIGPFPPEVEPVHVGYYPRQHPFTTTKDYWDGARWVDCDMNGDHMQLPALRWPWWGLAEPWTSDDE
jgi:hypothetical protein